MCLFNNFYNFFYFYYLLFVYSWLESVCLSVYIFINTSSFEYLKYKKTIKPIHVFFLFLLRNFQRSSSYFFKLFFSYLKKESTTEYKRNSNVEVQVHLAFCWGLQKNMLQIKTFFSFLFFSFNRNIEKHLKFVGFSSNSKLITNYIYWVIGLRLRRNWLKPLT